MLPVGFLAIALGLLVGLAGARFARRPPWDRPAFTRSPAWAAASWLGVRGGIGLGWILILRGAPGIALATALVLAAVAGRLAWVRSASYLAGRIATEARARLASMPRATPAERLRSVIEDRHPDWSPELIARMVDDHPDPGSLARIVVRMERLRIR